VLGRSVNPGRTGRSFGATYSAYGTWSRTDAYLSVSNSTFASFRSGASKPSVNQP
jgi:hypothetical protein